MRALFVTPVLSMAAALVMAGVLITPAAAAEGVPQLDVKASCDAAAQLESLDKKQFQSCMGDEATAKQLTEKEWSTFSGSAREECYSETTMDGSPSYVEMLECLRLARDAKKYPAQ